MVLKYSEDGYPYHSPPYDDAELAMLRRAVRGPPIAVYRRRETPAAGSPSPAAEGSDAASSPTPERR